MADQTPRMPNFWWCPTHHLYRGGTERPCADAVRLVPEAASETEWRVIHGADCEDADSETDARKLAAAHNFGPVADIESRVVGPWTVVES